MSAGGRGSCSVCKQDVAIKSDGGVHVHGAPCEGSGKPPVLSEPVEFARALAELFNAMEINQVQFDLYDNEVHVEGDWSVQMAPVVKNIWEVREL